MLLLVSFLLGTCSFKASNAGAHSQGHNFVFSIPARSRWCSSPFLLLTGATPDSTRVNVSITALSFSEQYLVDITDTVRVHLPDDTCISSPGLNDNTIIVSSQRPISVHAFNHARWGDGFLALPTSRLGSIYYIASYPAYSNYDSFFAVSSVDFRTTVEITPRDGNPTTVTLDPYETYVVLQDDPTGTRVQANHNVSVVAGSQFSSIPHGARSYEPLLEQLPSVDGLGRKFFLGPFKGRNSGYICRIIGVSESPTAVHISTNVTIRLNSGNFSETDVPDPRPDHSLLEIVSDNPILVMQYTKSYDTDETGDASMVLIPPIEHYSTNVHFPVAQMSRFTYYVNVAITCAHKSNLYFDGESMAGSSWEVLVNVSVSGSMCMLRRQVESGLHHLVHRDNASFHATVYGYHYEYTYAYAYPAAINVYMDNEGQLSTTEQPMSETATGQLSTTEQPMSETATDVKSTASKSTESTERQRTTLKVTSDENTSPRIIEYSTIFGSTDVDISSDIAATKPSITRPLSVTTPPLVPIIILTQGTVNILVTVGGVIILLFLVIIAVGVALLCRKRTESSNQVTSSPPIEMASAQGQRTPKEDIQEYADIPEMPSTTGGYTEYRVQDPAVYESLKNRTESCNQAIGTPPMKMTSAHGQRTRTEELPDHIRPSATVTGGHAEYGIQDPTVYEVPEIPDESLKNRTESSNQATDTSSMEMTATQGQGTQKEELSDYMDMQEMPSAATGGFTAYNGQDPADYEIPDESLKDMAESSQATGIPSMKMASSQRQRTQKEELPDYMVIPEMPSAATGGYNVQDPVIYESVD